jgi:hypothetical protein
MHVEVRRQFVGRDSLLPPYELQGLNSIEPQVASAFIFCRACQPMPLILKRFPGAVGMAPTLPVLRKHCKLEVSLGYKVPSHPNYTVRLGSKGKQAPW